MTGSMLKKWLYRAFAALSLVILLTAAALVALGFIHRLRSDGPGDSLVAFALAADIVGFGSPVLILTILFRSWSRNNKL